MTVPLLFKLPAASLNLNNYDNSGANGLKLQDFLGNLSGTNRRLLLFVDVTMAINF